MKAFKKFLGKYGDEIQFVASIGQALIGSVAMPHDQREKVEKSVEALERAAKNIAESLPTLAEGAVSAKEVAKSINLEQVAKALPGELFDALVKRAVEDVKTAVTAELAELIEKEAEEGTVVMEAFEARIAALEAAVTAPASQG